MLRPRFTIRDLMMVVAAGAIVFGGFNGDPITAIVMPSVLPLLVIALAEFAGRVVSPDDHSAG